MRKVILQDWVTLDGFASGPNGELDFITAPKYPRAGLEEDQLRFIGTIDTILLGAVTYRMFAKYWPEATTDKEMVADALNATPKVVFSKSIDRAPWGKWEEARVVKSSAADEVARLKKLNGKDMVIWGSISLAQSLIAAGLIDEYQFRVCPIAIGKGRQVFPENIASLGLKLLESKTYESGILSLSYAPG